MTSRPESERPKSDLYADDLQPEELDGELRRRFFESAAIELIAKLGGGLSASPRRDVVDEAPNGE